MIQRFGKYELLDKLATGGMAEVYLARTHGAEGFVKELVIKRILPQLNEDPGFVSMFINEARLAARLQHANIVQIYDFDHVGGDYYIAMELVDGADLRRIQNTARRREMPLSPRLGIHLGVEALKGLHYAHTRELAGEALGIVHRDISPHNLLLSFAGEVKIVDFGIAKVAALHGATGTGVVKGKLTYMAPEQVRGAPVDARTDLYALGIVLWEVLAGRRRYEGIGSESELVVAAQRGEVPLLVDLLPSAEAGVGAVIDRLLRPDPDDRYGSAAEALADLSRFSHGTDAFEVSAYLRGLLPAGAERDRRGKTVPVEPHAPSVVAAPADAPTATVDAAKSSPEPEAPAALESALARTREDTPPPTNLRFWGVLLAGFVGCGAAGAGVSYLLTRATPRRASAPIREVATHTLSAPTRVEGVPLIAGKLYGFAGQRLEIGRGGTKREIVLGGPSTPPVPTRQTVDGSPAADASPSRAPPVVAVDATPPIPRVRPPAVEMPPSRGSSRRAGGSRTIRRPDLAKGGKTVRRGFGYLTVSVTPWAWVQVDGQKRLQTPVTKLKLRVGNHTLRLANAELKKNETLKITIRKDAEKRIRRNW